MKKIDDLAIDRQSLNTFLLICEEASVTGAAKRLGVTQSTVSHTLAKLRAYFGDPLFVRSGNILIPTDRALVLQQPAKQVLADFEILNYKRAFDPQFEKMSFLIAANDLQRELIFPQLLRESRSEGILISLAFVSSGHPSSTMMREPRCDLALTPFPPDVSDVIQKPILTGSMKCFFDGAMRDRPATWKEYCAADHITVRFSDGGTSLRALSGVDKTKIPEGVVTVPNFNAVPAFIKGTKIIATELNLMKLCSLSSLDMAPLPFESDPVSMYMIWHKSRSSDPALSWLRQRISQITQEIKQTTVYREG